LIWAAVRFGLRGVTLANLAIAMISVYATAHGRGPFSGQPLAASLFNLQTFMGLAVLTALVLAAAVAGRNQAIRRRDDFLSTAAHELRNPINTLQIGIQLIARVAAKDGALSESLAPHIQRTTRQSDRIVRLVEQLLDVTRVASGHLELAPKPMDLG